MENGSQQKGQSMSLLEEEDGLVGRGVARRSTPFQRRPSSQAYYFPIFMGTPFPVGLSGFADTLIPWKMR